MKKEVADKWVAELRSGKYEQGKGYLNKDGKFCCLGVLCDLAAKEGEVSKIDADIPSGKYIQYDKSLKFAPISVRTWSGLRTSGGAFRYSDKNFELYSLNDDDGLSFEEIANVIEKNWESL